MSRIFLLLLSTLWIGAAWAQSPPGHSAIKQAAEVWLRSQIKGISGEVSIEIGAPSTTATMAPCGNFSFSRPSGAPPWGRGYILARCLDSPGWRINLPVTIRIHSEYYVATRSINQGQIISVDDLMLQAGDISELSVRTITDINQAIGKVAAISIPPGSPLRSDMLKAMTVIRQGQNVKVVSRGTDFEVVNEGRALGNVAEGQMVHVRMPNGQVVTGIAKADSSVEIKF